MANHMDQFGFPIEIASKEALAQWNQTVLAFLAHAAATPEHLGAALDADENFARGFLAKGYFCALLGRSEMRRAARDAYERVVTIRKEQGLDSYDTTLLLALDDLTSGRMAAAADRLDALLPTRPKDAFLAKLIHAIRFVMGDHIGMRESIEGVIPAYEDDNPGAGFMYGCHAFALEETGQFERAESAGRHALDLAPNDAWGLHAVAHVHDMCGTSAEGINWLTQRRSGWEHCNNFRYHVWWHLALFHLDRKDYGAVLDLYDTEVRPDHTDDYRDISNAASLLSRLELEGVSVGNRWEEMAALSENRVNDQCLAFADLHYMLALLGGDRQEAAGTLLHQMRAKAQSLSDDQSEVDRTVGVPVAAGLSAFASGDYHAANASLSRAIGSLQSVGGSHAQRDVFERIAIEAALRAGADDAMEHLLAHRAERRGGTDSFAQSRLRALSDLRQSVTSNSMVRSGTTG